MKRTFLFFFILLITNCIYAQNYNQLTKNIGWCIEEYVSLGSTPHPYVNKGDTLINNFTYKKIAKYNSIITLLREDTIQKKIWAILPDSTSETLIYDFNLIMGNQIILDFVNYPQITYIVDSVDTVTTPLGNRKRINLSTNDTTLAPTLTWIEGIGSTYGPIYLLDKTLAASTMGGNGHCLICCYHEVGLQAYLGSCGIHFASLEGTSCSSFITSVEDSHSNNSNVKAYFSASNLLSIQSEEGRIKTIQIFSVNGELIGQYKINEEHFSILTKRWNKGIYLVRITLDNNQIINQKIIKQ